MRIKRLRLVNFMPYAEEDLEFDKMEGPILLLGRIADGTEGESNGAGKSAVLDSVAWSLFGESRVKSDDDLIRGSEDEMSVTVAFSMEGKDYEVVRGKRRGRSQVLWLTDLTDDVKLTGNSVKETQMAILKVVGMDGPMFEGTVFCRQHEMATFAGQTPAKRKAVLASILGLDEYAVLEERAKGMAAGYEKDVASLDMAVRRCEEEAGQLAVPDGEIAKASAAVCDTDMSLMEYEENLRVTEGELGARFLEEPRAIAVAIVGEQLLRSNAPLSEPTNRSAKEGGRVDLALVGQDLHVGQAAVVVDADVSELPAGARTGPSPIAVDAVADAAESAELLGVEVQQLSGPLTLVAAHRRLGLEGAEPA